MTPPTCASCRYLHDTGAKVFPTARPIFMCRRFPKYEDRAPTDLCGEWAEKEAR